MAKRVGYNPAMAQEQSFGEWYNEHRLVLNPIVTGSVVGLVGVVNMMTMPLWPHTILWVGTGLTVLGVLTCKLKDSLQRAFYRAVLLAAAGWMIALQTPLASFEHWRAFSIAWFCATVLGCGGYWTDQRVREKIHVAKDLASWPQLSRRIGIPLAWITNKIKTESGYRRRLSWPDGEYTLEQVRALKGKIEAALKIPTGQLRFEEVIDGNEDGNPNAIDLVINTASKARKAPVAFGDPTMRSITDQMFVGPYEDGELCKIYWWEQGFGGIHTLAAGKTRSGKALALDTPIATPTGWTTMGVLRTGDEVFGDDGQVYRVTFAHPVQTDRPCYEVTFSDGERIIADEAHEWWVESRQARLSRFQAKRHDENRARRIALPDHAVDSLRALAAARREVTLSEVAQASGLNAPTTMLRRTAATVKVCGAIRQQRTYRDGSRPMGVRTYPAVELIERYIAVGTKPAGDQRHKRGGAQVLTTREIAETVLTASGHANYSIPLTAPLALPDAVLPVAPYTLGVFLGDGANRDGRITSADPDVLARIWADGYQVGPPEPAADSLALTYGVYGLSARLRKMGLLAGNGAPSAKHIPTEYLRGSVGQRRALLAGLLDTDGTVAPQGTVHFDNTCRRLAGGVLELALSLGYRTTMTEKDATLNGQVMGRTWRVAFTTTDPVFGLHRKLEALRERTAHSNIERINNRYIVSVEPVESRAVRCITVDSPSHLFLAGRSMIPTHNSGLYRLMLGDSAACEDVVRLGIDAKGGMALRPWSPLFEWLVVGNDTPAREETGELLQWLDAMMTARATYAGEHKWDVWRVSKRHPLIILYVDEAAEVFGLKYENFAAVQLVEKIGRMGAGIGVLLCAATQYPTVDAIASSQIQSQIGRRFCFKVAKKEHQHVILPNGGGVDATFPGRPAGSKSAGWCFLSDDGNMREQPLRVRNLAPERVFEIVSANIEHKGKLDELSARVDISADAYANRRRWTLDDANPAIDPTGWDDEADEMGGPPRDDEPQIVTEPALNPGGGSVTERVTDATEDVTEMVTETATEEYPETGSGLTLADMVRPRTEADAAALALAQAEFAASMEEWTTDRATASFWATLEIRGGRAGARGPGSRVANLTEACHRGPTWVHEMLNRAVLDGQICRVKEGSPYYRMVDGVRSPDMEEAESGNTE